MKKDAYEWHYTTNMDQIQISLKDAAHNDPKICDTFPKITDTDFAAIVGITMRKHNIISLYLIKHNYM